MEPLRVFCIIVICGTEQLNKVPVMARKMKLGKVEVGPDTEIDENIFVVVETAQSIVKKVQSFIRVNWIVSKVKEVYIPLTAQRRQVGFILSGRRISMMIPRRNHKIWSCSVPVTRQR